MTEFFDALHRALLASNSATAVLERFFGGPITVRRMEMAPLAPGAEQRARLLLVSEADWGHRRVQLVLGRAVLSEADLWYVPSRLPAEICAALLHGDTPFGRLVSSLQPERRSISALMYPAPSEMALEHRAVLVAEAGPIAEVHERYPAGLAGRMKLAG